MTLKKMNTILIVTLLSFGAIAQQDYKTPSLPKNKGLPKKESLSAQESKKIAKYRKAYTKALIKSLKSIVVLSSTSELDKRPGKKQGLEFKHETKLNQTPEFKDLLEGFLNKPFSQKSVDDLNREIVAFYRLTNYPMVDVYFPQQDLTDGVLQVVIVEAKVGEIKVVGNKYFSDKHILKAQKTAVAGEKPYVPGIYEDANWLSQNPYLKVQPVFAQGSTHGDTNLELQVEDSLPLRVFGSYNNEGNNTTGRHQYTAGMNYANLWGRAHQLNYQYTTVEDLDSLRTHALSYIAPLAWRHTLIFTASSTRTATNLSGLLSDGESDEVSIGYKVPFKPVGNYEHSINYGLNWKRSQNALEFGVIPISDNEVQLGQLNIAYSGKKPYSKGVNSFTASVRKSIPGLFSHQEDSDYNQVRPGATNDFWAYRLDYGHQLNLPKNMLLVNTVSLQYAPGRLIQNEQLSITGAAGVRGYAAGIFSNADSGALVKTDLYSPTFSFFDLDKWRALVFFDLASFGAKDNNLIVPSSVSRGSRTVSSAGLGMRLNIGRWASLSGDYGFQLTDVEDDGDKKGRWHISINAQW